MKNKILSLCFLVLFSTSCKEKPFQLDDIILQCYEPTYQKEGYDIKTIIDDYEQLLIKEGVLKDDSGKSYLEVLQKINADKDFRIESKTFQEFDPWFKVKPETTISRFECEYEMLELVKNTKWHRFVRTSESSETAENTDEVYRAMIETLSEEDFESYYIRLYMFTLFDGVNTKWGDRSLMPTVSAE